MRKHGEEHSMCHALCREDREDAGEDLDKRRLDQGALTGVY